MDKDEGRSAAKGFIVYEVSVDKDTTHRSCWGLLTILSVMLLPPVGNRLLNSIQNRSNSAVEFVVLERLEDILFGAQAQAVLDLGILTPG